MGSDRLRPDHRRASPADGTALGHRRAEAVLHCRLCDFPRIGIAVRLRGQRGHPDRVARDDGARRLHDAGDVNGDAPFDIRRERARQGARSPAERGGCGRGWRTGGRRFRRGPVRLAGSVPADDRSRGDRHKLRAGGPEPEQDGRRDIGRAVRPRRRRHLHSGPRRVPARDYQPERSSDGGRRPSRAASQPLSDSRASSRTGS